MAISFKTHNFTDWHEITTFIGEGLSICEFEPKETVFSEKAFDYLIKSILSGEDFKKVVGNIAIPSRADSKISKVRKISVKYLDGTVRSIENETIKNVRPTRIKRYSKESGE